MERQLSWDMPTEYTDNTPLGSTEASRIKVHVFKDGIETYVTLPGVKTWPIEVGSPGIVSSWQLTAELDGQTSAKSPPLVYTEPFLVPMPPKSGAIS